VSFFLESQNRHEWFFCFMLGPVGRDNNVFPDTLLLQTLWK
jgi:hypothetical protein